MTAAAQTRRDTALIKSENPPMMAAQRLGLSVTRKNSALHAPCPGCGKPDKFSIHADSGAFNCFTCDVAGGDVIALTMVIRGVDFLAACDWLGGERELSADERAALLAKQREAEKKAADAAARKAKVDKTEIKTVLGQLKPGAGSLVERYLIGRGLRSGLIALGWLNADGSAGAWPKAVSFHPSLPAFAGASGSRKSVGHHPCMVCLGRNASGHIVLLHRTFLSDNPDGTVTKLEPDLPDGVTGWNAKQILGSLSACDGGVFLGATDELTHNPNIPSLVGEGIETVLAVAAAGVAGAFYAGLSLNRIVGSRSINALGNRGFGFPDDGRARIVLTDHDLSPTLAFPDDPDADGLDRDGGHRRAVSEFTRAQTRLSENGDRVELAWPPIGTDFNDALIAA